MIVEIPEIPLSPEPVTPEAKKVLGFKWGDPSVGHRHKLGGVPDWIHPEDTPSCPECHDRMSFYAQLDSIGDEITIADCGMIFTFVCFGCFQVHSLIQTA